MSATPHILLVGHGSSRTPRTNERVFELAEALRRELDAEVHAAFFKGAPSVADVVRTHPRASWTVVPVALADGWFSTTVIPRLVREALDEAKREARTPSRNEQRNTQQRGPESTPENVRFTPSLGGANAWVDALETQHRDACSARGWPSAPLVVVGHGTPRNPASSTTLKRAVAALVERGVPAYPAFLDQEPDVAQVVPSFEGPVVVAPFFLADGAHPRWDVPEELGLPRDPNPNATYSLADASVAYLAAMGEHPAALEALRAVLYAAAEAEARSDALDGDTPND